MGTAVRANGSGNPKRVHFDTLENIMSALRGTD